MTGTYVGAIDQGTTGTRFMAFDRAGRVVANAYRTHEQFYPRPGWVEHDPDEIRENARQTTREALADAGIAPGELAALGITNQRETTVLWDAETGEPVHDALVWQDRRTTDRIEELIEEGWEPTIRETTGLEPDAYFSATKLEWLLDELDLRGRAERGEVLFGTIDSWLIYDLTGAHVTDVTNASRTMLFDVRACEWDDELLSTFGVPRECLPEVRPSSDDEPYGHVVPGAFDGRSTSSEGADAGDGIPIADSEDGIPITAALGDQHAALFGQTCFDPGEGKNTYGTGSFFLLNTGEEPVESEHGLLTTIAYQCSGERPRYALEGSIFSTGATIEWLADVDLIEDPEASERLAGAVESTDDVYLVPAFAGLGAPHWDGRARGTIVGVTRGTRKEHLVRAALESIAYQTRDVAEAMGADSGIEPRTLRVDGGAVKNDLLCQLQADVLDVPVVRPAVEETTALGAAYAAGLAVGYWDSLDELRENARTDRTFEPRMDATDVDHRYERWGEAVERAKGWARE